MARDLHSRVRYAILEPAARTVPLVHLHGHLFAHPRDSIHQHLYDLRGEGSDTPEDREHIKICCSTLFDWDSFVRAQREIRPSHFRGRLIGAGNPWLLVLDMVWLLLGIRQPRVLCGSFSASLSTPDGAAT